MPDKEEGPERYMVWHEYWTNYGDGKRYSVQVGDLQLGNLTWAGVMDWLRHRAQPGGIMIEFDSRTGDIRRSVNYDDIPNLEELP